MKRIKTKLLIVLLLALGVFAYHSYTSIGDSDVKNEAQSLVEKKFGNSSAVEFSDVEIVQKMSLRKGRVIEFVAYTIYLPKKTLCHLLRM
ncbi:hypothetical protein [Providencia rettgeri]|uniref:hypothetical protein n=1 Tax=Providencia rettgeri TaxID=587 RepID=UPI0020D1F5C1